MYNALNLEGIRENSRSIAVNTGGYIFMFGCLFTAAVLFLGAFGLLPIDPLLLAGFVFFVFGLAAFAAGLYYLLDGAGQTKRVVNKGINALDRELEFRFPTPDLPELPAPTLPALPAEDEPIRYSHYSRGVEEIPRKLLHGFDPRDLEWLTKYLANGGKFTEAAMEFMPLPHSGEKLGKAAENTPYTRFMDVCTRSGIITGREGKKSGQLAIFTAPEMMTAIRNLPEA